MLDTMMTYMQEYWILWLFGIVLVTLSINLLARRLLRMIAARASKTKNLWDDALIASINRPLGWAIWLFGINFAALYTAKVNNLPWEFSLELFNKTVVIVLLVWALLQFIKLAERNLTSAEYLREPVDRTTAQAIRKLIQASVLITMCLVILQLYGISVSGVLAFGGIGGIAVGFAARDMLANFFGAVMVYLDKPFSVGDWVRSPDRDIEGVVEDIGWRRTLIRTFDKRPLYVPNSVFVSILVENPSRMQNRRIYETMGIRYSDMALLPKIVEEVKDMLKAHPEIELRQTLMVNFNLFGASSLDFFIYCFTKTTDWVKYHEVKQDVLLKIEQIITDNGAEFAFPTQTVHLHSELPDKLLPQTPVQ